LFWSTMTIEAPLHLQRTHLTHERHLIDASVAGLTAHSLFDVDAVIEINKVWKVVHANPVERTVIPEAGAHRFEKGRIGPDLRVTVHTGLGRRNSGKRGCFNRGVAIPAIDPVV